LVEGEAFYIHADLVARRSEPLDRMMHGDMAEAKQGYAILEDVDRATFARFAEWLYQGYYTPADFVQQPPKAPKLDNKENGNPSARRQSRVEEVVSGPDESLDPGFGSRLVLMDASWVQDRDVGDTAFSEFGTTCRKNKGKKYARRHSVEESWNAATTPSRSTRSDLEREFINIKSSVRQENISIPPARSNLNPEEDYSDVFLSHAQLYVFAEKYEIEMLRMLALETLQHLLAIFTLYEDRTEDVITLLRYAYAHTRRSSIVLDDLQAMLKHYVGYQMDVLMTNSKFQTLLLEDGGLLLSHFVEMVQKRLKTNRR
jgi:hypothetical protein